MSTLKQNSAHTIPEIMSDEESGPFTANHLQGGGLKRFWLQFGKPPSVIQLYKYSVVNLYL